MQRLKSLRHSVTTASLRFSPHWRRSLLKSVADSTAAATREGEDLQNQVLVEGRSCSRAAVLNRPAALNALTTNMGIRLKKLYESWEDNSDIGFVMMKGSGRAFCAGGDVVALYRLIEQGKVEDCKDFFRNSYMFIYILGTYLKPHVAILDGITMGGGAGISVPGTFRVATDRSIFATPEIHIGFHPDAGASFYLSHLTGHVGEYLALTGERLNGVDMVAIGLATHFSMSDKLSWVDERLAKLMTDDPSVIDSSLAQYGDVVYPDKTSIVHRLKIIDKCFCHDTVEEIIDALEEEANRSNQDWCISAVKKLKEASPLSLKVSLKSIREGRYQTLDECLVREYRMSLHGISKEISNDFHEGVRARLVDKDMAPKWDPPTLEHVSVDMIDSYFSPLEEFEPELKLPTNLREAFV
ncbi:3-hydroxyisobutyryl-CoA hydrolase-like protein 2, mitochondrial [Iris pallida]|uniref:3-hydroxyisobutyryl-CoA hydrolase n=1 Tax=Iris pallida TaxID=29817 RepID=A0AAX6GBK0_IRIPA|nr:3-hydroxyisobutyryl-CoA hydrolase-like protein 2, mitochondrial [Iris pallida]